MSDNEPLDPEIEAAAVAYLTGVAAFSSGTDRTCPYCHTPIAGVRKYMKIEPDVFSLYVLPCEHRLGLWGDVPLWVYEAGLTIETIEFEVEAWTEEEVAEWEAEYGSDNDPELYDAPLL